MTERAQPPMYGDLLRPECRDDVVRRIRESGLPNGRKRALYLRWLLAVGVPWGPGDLEDVITERPRATNGAGSN